MVLQYSERIPRMAYAVTVPDEWECYDCNMVETDCDRAGLCYCSCAHEHHNHPEAHGH